MDKFKVKREKWKVIIQIKCSRFVRSFSPLFTLHSSLAKQTGVTLIETMVGLMVLTVGIGGAASLAVSSLASTTNTTKQIIATGLAREAQEAVRNMRDTNWLKTTTMDSDCWDYAGGNTALCYKNWQNPVGGGIYNINPAVGGSYYVLDYDPGNVSGIFWNFRLANGAYRVYSQNVINGQLYIQQSNATPSSYYRKITLLEESSASPYNQNIGPKLKVVVQVWWVDKGCPETADWPGITKCGLEFESFLSNWKNY